MEVSRQMGARLCQFMAWQGGHIFATELRVVQQMESCSSSLCLTFPTRRWFAVSLLRCQSSSFASGFRLVGCLICSNCRFEHSAVEVSRSAFHHRQETSFSACLQSALLVRLLNHLSPQICVTWCLTCVHVKYFRHGATFSQLSS